MKIWIVEQWIQGDQFERQGVFSTKEKAIAACRNWRYCYYPLTLDEELPDEKAELDNIYPIPVPEGVDINEV